MLSDIVTPSFPIIGILYYIYSVDLVNDNVYTKFCLNLSIRSQDIEQKPNSDVNRGP